MKILCMGDSLTFGFGVPRKEGWTALAQKELGVEIVNRGIPGDTTGGMVARYGNEIEKHRPALVSIMGGFNDIFFGGDDRPARANTAAMIHQTTSRNIIPLLCTPVPVVVESARKEWAELVDFFAAQETGREYVAWLRLFAETFRIPFLDFWAFFENELREKGGDAGLYVDGLHPNARGQAVMARMFVDTVKTALADKL
ncbi:MAG: GDSL-type esterase/lipase family protein [Planctomycetota bacterium]|nr:GDSL-type esterase/lipase family protein [Planctomycetota bacterium]